MATGTRFATLAEFKPIAFAAIVVSTIRVKTYILYIFQQSDDAINLL